MILHQRMRPFLAIPSGRYEPFSHIAPRCGAGDRSGGCPCFARKKTAADDELFRSPIGSASKRNEPFPVTANLFVIADPADADYVNWLREQHIQLPRAPACPCVPARKSAGPYSSLAPASSRQSITRRSADGRASNRRAESDSRRSAAAGCEVPEDRSPRRHGEELTIADGAAEPGQPSPLAQFELIGRRKKKRACLYLLIQHVISPGEIELPDFHHHHPRAKSSTSVGVL